MALIKKFRIKSFKKVDPIIQVKKLSLSFGNRKILDGINFSINKVKYLAYWDQMELVNLQFLTL